MYLTIARKELKSMFSSPVGWIVLAIVTGVFGAFFNSGFTNYFEVMSGAIRPAERIGVTQFVGQTVYGAATFIMMMAVPMLSMRMIAEERRNQTMPFLSSAPLSIVEIVIGKFLGLVAFLSILVVYIALLLSTLNLWADIDFGYIIANSIGLFLVVASFSALGLYFSSLTSQPIVAAILTFIAAFALMAFDVFFGSDPSSLFSEFSFVKHFSSFSSGLIDTGDIAYFVLFIVTFLTLTVRRLDADRLRG